MKYYTGYILPENDFEKQNLKCKQFDLNGKRVTLTYDNHNKWISVEFFWYLDKRIEGGVMIKNYTKCSCKKIFTMEFVKFCAWDIVRMCLKELVQEVEEFQPYLSTGNPSASNLGT